MLQLFPDESGLQRIEIKGDAIIAGDRQALRKIPRMRCSLSSPNPNRSRSRVPRAVSGSQVVSNMAPFTTKRSACGERLRPVEQTLVNEARQQDVERLVGLPREIEQARPIWTQTLGRIEDSVRDMTADACSAFLAEAGAEREVLSAAAEMKRLAGQINVTIHALGILLCLPHILEAGASRIRIAWRREYRPPV